VTSRAVRKEVYVVLSYVVVIHHSNNRKLIYLVLPGKAISFCAEVEVQLGSQRGLLQLGRASIDPVMREGRGISMECSACDLTLGQPQLPWHPDACQSKVICLIGL
jgi:hypothetical protein